MSAFRVERTRTQPTRTSANDPAIRMSHVGTRRPLGRAKHVRSNRVFQTPTYPGRARRATSESNTGRSMFRPSRSARSRERNARSARRRLNIFNQLRHPPVENILRSEEVGLKGDEQVAGLAVLLWAGSAEQSQCLYHQCQPEAFVTAERQQCATACKHRVPGRLAVGPDCHA